MPKDYYAILGVGKDAGEDEIKKAFRRLAHEHHPDKGGDAKKFKDINEAYQVLGDKQKRGTYDQFGSAAFEQGGAGQGFGGFGDFGGFNFNQGFQAQDFGDLGDVLGEMFGFGGGRSARRAASGKDIEVDAQLSFREAAFGVERAVKLYKPVVCARCAGSGAEPGSKTVSCSTCQGTGRVRRAQRTMFGVIQTAGSCGDCGGTGNKPEKTCGQCHGAGVERREISISIPIPAGIQNDETLKVPGQGEAALRGGRAGDLFIRVTVTPDDKFERDGHDVLSQERVSFSLLTLGGTISVQTLDGAADIRVGEGTPSGSKFVLRGQGIPFGRSRGRGDHVVTLLADVPKKLSRDQRKLFEDLKNLGL